MSGQTHLPSGLYGCSVNITHRSYRWRTAPCSGRYRGGRRRRRARLGSAGPGRQDGLRTAGLRLLRGCSYPATNRARPDHRRLPWTVGPYVAQAQYADRPICPPRAGGRGGTHQHRLSHGRGGHHRGHRGRPPDSAGVGVAQEQGYRGLVSVPLRRAGTVVGALNGYHAEPHRFDQVERGPGLRRWPRRRRSPCAPRSCLRETGHHPRTAAGRGGARPADRDRAAR